MANHPDPRTTKVYDRRKDLASLSAIFANLRLRLSKQAKFGQHQITSKFADSSPIIGTASSGLRDDDVKGRARSSKTERQHLR
jgi:hypothetical protein